MKTVDSMEIIESYERFLNMAEKPAGDPVDMTPQPWDGVVNFREWPAMGGVFAKHQMPNGYGISVIRFNGSCGGDEGLYQLGVTDESGQLVYDTPITDNVIGWMTEADVLEVAEKVAALPAKQ